MHICSVAVCSDKYHNRDAGPLTKGVGNRPTKQNKLRSERGQTLLFDLCLYCGHVCTVAETAGCKRYVKVQEQKTSSKPTRSKDIPCFQLSLLFLTQNLLLWDDTKSDSLVMVEYRMNTECGKESVPLVVNKPRDTKSSFNNISTKFQHETCRGRKHHQERERYKLYRVFRLSPYGARQLYSAESMH